MTSGKLKLPSAELLDDICVRFILTLPATELESFERLLFSVEQAWWHYEDYVRSRPENAELRSLGLKEFTGLIFASCPGLEPFRGSLEQIYAEFTEYKRTVPVRGAILLNSTMTKCLLVRGFKEGSGWGFPKGKLSLNETDEACAVREVFEETGYDITPKLNSKHFIELKIGNQATKLYIVVDVDERTHFAPRVMGEIGGFGWHVVNDLPSSREESRHLYINDQGSRHRFFNVWPYIRKLQLWIEQELGRKKGTLTSMSYFSFDREQILKQIDRHLSL